MWRLFHMFVATCGFTLAAGAAALASEDWLWAEKPYVQLVVYAGLASGVFVGLLSGVVLGQDPDHPLVQVDQ